MNIETHTITRHLEGTSRVMLVKDREYTDEQLTAFPDWYKNYTKKAS